MDLDRGGSRDLPAKSVELGEVGAGGRTSDSNITVNRTGSQMMS